MSRQFPSLRGLAIIIVVLNHSIMMLTTFPKDLGIPPAQGLEWHLLTFLEKLGIFAVPTFLFISGGFFAYAARNSQAGVSPRMIWANLRHILLPYLFWSLVFYLILYVYHGISYSFPGYIKNLVVGYPFNFVPLLALFYLLSPLLVWAGKRHGPLLLLILGAYQFFLINQVYPGTWGVEFPSWLASITPPIVRQTVAVWGIYFPLGLVYGLNLQSAAPFLQRIRWPLVILLSIFFALSVLHAFKLITFALASHIAPLLFALLIPSIQRDSIPLVRQLEKVGKRAYGLYLMNLIILDSILVAIKLVYPSLLNYRLALLPFLFLGALLFPLLIMGRTEQAPLPQLHRAVFG